MSEKLPDILLIGDCSIDLFMRVDNDSLQSTSEGKLCFYHGSKVPVEQCKATIAGNACNVAMGCKRLGLDPLPYTELGDDENADKFIRELGEAGIDTSYCLKNPSTPTNVHAIISYADDRTIFSYHDKRQYKLWDWPKPKWLLYTSLGYGFEEFQKQLVEYLGENTDIGVAFNPGTQQLKSGVESLENFLAITDIIFVNRTEAELLTGEKDCSLLDLHKKLQKLGPKMTVITLGKRGSSVNLVNGGSGDGETSKETSDTLYEQPAAKPPKKPIDKTGAGDAYTSGFLSAIIKGKNVETAMKWGSENSASVITEIGAIHGLVTADEL